MVSPHFCQRYWCTSMLSLGILIFNFFNNKFQNFIVSHISWIMKWCPSKFILWVFVLNILKDQLTNFPVTVFCSKVERGQSITYSWWIWFVTIFNKFSNNSEPFNFVWLFSLVEYGNTKFFCRLFSHENIGGVVYWLYEVLLKGIADWLISCRLSALC